MEAGDRCVFCKQRDSHHKYPVTDMFDDAYAIRHCHHCNAYFLSPRPTEEKLARAYDDTYYGQHEEKFNPFIEKVLDVFRRSRSSYLLKHLHKGDRILDVGCGNGRFLQFLQKNGSYGLYGVEMPGNSARRAARIKDIHLHVGTLQPDTYPHNFFHAVTLFHVFEHLAEPQETLEVISSIMQKDGLLVVSFPNINSWQSKLFKGRWLHLDPPRHLFFFKPQDFVSLMKNYGFEPVKEKYVSAEQNPYGMVQSVLNMLCRKRELLFERLKGNTNYGKTYSRGVVWLHLAFFLFSFPLFICTDLIAGALKKGATVTFTFIKR